MTNAPAAPETEKIVYLVTFHGKKRLIEADDLRTLKAFLLSEGGFTSKTATGPEVMNFYKEGGAVETATPIGE
jgi:hypothetical protein